jgi:predicted dehydrogenase
MNGRTRFGILGTGTIAKKFAEGLRDAPGAELAAVGSRSASTARAFAAELGVSRAHDSYEALCADPAVDVIYVATPHTRHRDDTLLALAAGKHVLCEKPFAMNLREAEAMVAAARRSGLFLMEAMWTRFNPVMGELRRLLDQGAIGEVRTVLIDFGFRADFDPSGRLFDPALGGGALLDVGVYCVSLAHLVLGGPALAYVGTAELGATGVDEQSAWIGRWPNGALAVMSAAIRTDTPMHAVLCGTKGTIRIPEFWNPRALAVDEVLRPIPVVGNAYQYQAIEVMRCLREGLRESPRMTLDMTLAIQRDLDRIRGQWGLRYPADA